MNKLDPKDLHLLIDEPIYLLNDHIHQEEETIEESKVEEPNVELVNPATTKDIIIVIDNVLSQDDEVFLYKGLNALDVTKDDISILDSSALTQEDSSPSHKKEIFFNEIPDVQKIYRTSDNLGISHLECHSISKIRGDQDLKRKFWEALKAFFGK